MTSIVFTRIGQWLVAAAILAGMALAVLPVASAERAWDLQQFDDCVLSGQHSVEECCVSSGGDWVVKEGFDEVGHCYAPPATEEGNVTPTGPRKPTVPKAGVPNPAQSDPGNPPAKPNVTGANVSEPGLSQPPNQPKKPSVPKANVSTPGESQTGSPSNSGLS